MVKKQVMKKWTWELVVKVIEENLPEWKINQNKTDILRCTMKIKLLCSRGHENEKRATDIGRGSGLGCSQCNKENKGRKTYFCYSDALEKEGWTMLSSLEKLLESEGKYAQTPLEIVCPNGELHLTCWNSFSQGSRCSCSLCRPNRSGIKKGQKHKIKGIADAREIFRNIGFRVAK